MKTQTFHLKTETGSTTATLDLSGKSDVLKLVKEGTHTSEEWEKFILPWIKGIVSKHDDNKALELEIDDPKHIRRVLILPTGHHFVLTNDAKLIKAIETNSLGKPKPTNENR